jgi:hypothetical protein
METTWNSSHDRHWQSESRSLEIRPISNKISDQIWPVLSSSSVEGNPCLDAEFMMFGWDRVEIESSTVWVSRRIRYLSDAESEMHEADLSLQCLIHRIQFLLLLRGRDWRRGH